MDFMDTELLTLAAPLGVGGVLALGMFLVHRRDMQQHISNWQGQSQMLVQVVKDNTVAITKLTEHLDRVIELVKDRQDR